MPELLVGRWGSLGFLLSRWFNGELGARWALLAGLGCSGRWGRAGTGTALGTHPAPPALPPAAVCREHRLRERQEEAMGAEAPLGKALKVLV